MTLPVIFHDLAEVELNEAAAYYARARPGLGDAFVAEVQGAVDAWLRHRSRGVLWRTMFAGGSCGDFPTACCTGYATITFVFSRLHIRSGGPSTGAGANSPAPRLLARGSDDALYVGRSTVLRTALDMAAHSFVLAHNHPSGDPTPTREDEAIALELRHLSAELHVRAGISGTLKESPPALIRRSSTRTCA
ncbi:JAB domain-containing protein [Sorangium sp. So ce1014]|uniref:JAB domain-containing protein n=1 Tax=Sorangium sp. So ce1014 TaxID=3133326 RepID=UPI003F62B357